MDTTIFRRWIERSDRILAEQQGAITPDRKELWHARMGRMWGFWMLGDFADLWSELGPLIRAEREAGGLPAQEPAAHPWDGSPRDGRGLLIDAERLGGFGDLMQWMRFVADLDPAAGPVTVLTRPDLVRLFASSFDGRIAWITPESASHPAELVANYYWLPMLLRLTHDDLPGYVPYLRPPAALATVWRQKLAGRPRPWVGLCWSNTQPGACRDERYVPLDAFAPLTAERTATFVSLQKESRADEIDAAGAGDRILDFGDEIRDFADTAALMADLDLVVSIDTSVGHLAGAMGRRTWLLLMHDFFEGWLMGDDPEAVPWYPTARLCRQPEAADWNGLLTELGRRFDRLLEEG